MIKLLNKPKMTKQTRGAPADFNNGDLVICIDPSGSSETVRNALYRVVRTEDEKLGRGRLVYVKSLKDGTTAAACAYRFAKITTT